MQRVLPRVAHIGTGGSISFKGRHRLDLVEYGDYGPMLPPDELVATVPEIADEADVLPVPFRALSSVNISPQDWLELNDLIHRIVQGDEPPAGIVISHGTATIEETGYFLHLTLKTDVPVVCVGAQRPSNGLSTDASLNLLNAIRVAGSPHSRGLGVLVAMNSEIHSARDVMKSSTYALDAFASPDFGCLGYAGVDGKIEIYRRPQRPSTLATEFDPRGLTTLPKVEISYSYAGCDGTAIDAFVAKGANAVVVASMAPGKPSPGEARAALDARRQGVFMIQSSRAGRGRVVERTLLRKQGFIAADNLSPQKARVLAMLALTRTNNFDELQSMFSKY